MFFIKEVGFGLVTERCEDCLWKLGKTAGEKRCVQLRVVGLLAGLDADSLVEGHLLDGVCLYRCLKFMG